MPPLKDFRTWHATVLAGGGPGRIRIFPSAARAARRHAIVRVVQEVAGYLGNTPAVARASYIDPRVIEHYEAEPHHCFRAGRAGQGWPLR